MRDNLYFVGIVLILLCFATHTEAFKQDRNKLKRNMENIAFNVSAALPGLNGVYGVVAGDITTGRYCWNSGSSMRTSRYLALAQCGCNGQCEELFTLTLFNNTRSDMNVYIFAPWETDFSEEKALWNWIITPNYESTPSINGRFLFFPRGMYMKAKLVDGTRVWEARRLDRYSYTQLNYSYGQCMNIWFIH